MTSTVFVCQDTKTTVRKHLHMFSLEKFPPFESGFWRQLVILEAAAVPLFESGIDGHSEVVHEYNNDDIICE